MSTSSGAREFSEEVATAGPTILFASDCHGNNHQYAKVVQAALAMKVSAVLFGGDLSPKCQYAKATDYYGTMLAEQAAWIATQLPSLLSPLQAAGIPAYLIMGNGDVSANYELHLKNEADGCYTMVDSHRVSLGSHKGFVYELVGLPFVPFSWSSMKDFDVHDLIAQKEDVEDPLLRAMYDESFDPRSTYFGSSRVQPVHSCLQRTPENVRHAEEAAWKTVSYPPSRSATHSIERFLQHKVFHSDSPAVRTVLMAHSPPFGTVADMVEARHSNLDAPCTWCDRGGLVPRLPHKHVGSVALRGYIEHSRPWITLHGHIHSTTELSGTHIQVVDHRTGLPTYVVCSGNDPLYTANGARDGDRVEVPTGRKVWAVLVDLSCPAESKHLEL
jgi:Icc-related predicted phosphoesterase